MADHPLRSATDRRLGEPLPHQPANQTQVHPVPINLWPVPHAGSRCHKVLITVSSGYPFVQGRLPTRYSPVRRFPSNPSSEDSVMDFSLDLHVLGTPPAFILSQDQTLEKNCISPVLRQDNIWLIPNALRLNYFCILRIVLGFPHKYRLDNCDEILYIYKIFVLCSFQSSYWPVWVSLYILSPVFYFVKNFFKIFFEAIQERFPLVLWQNLRNPLRFLTFPGVISVCRSARLA